MDIPRKSAARNRLIRRIAIGAIVLAIGGIVTFGLSKMEKALPSVERGSVWPDTVKRGEMLRQVHGLGTLVPEEILSIPAVNDGRVERRLLLPGTKVKPDTVLLEMSNPVLQNDLVDSEWQVKAAEADYTDLRVRLESGRLDQEAALATIQSQYTQAKLQADLDKSLFEENLLVELKMKLSKNIADNLANRYAIDKRRFEGSNESVQAQLAVQQTRVERLRALYKLKQSQVEALKVRAGADGVLQQITAEVGQRVAAGTSLAKVVQPWRLKAVLQIQETQAKDVLIGQPASIDTRNGVVNGKVSRIDPTVQNGTRTVDVVLLEALPSGAVPDLSVEGTIELERLKDVVYMGRPVFGQPQSVVTMFKLASDGKTAQKTQIKLGRGSVTTIEILEGLKVGDQILLSDMSAYDQYDRIKLN